MISAIFATGPNGEFGFKGKLPWSNYKLELETFYSTLAQIKPQVLLMGAKTYLSLPSSVLNKMKETCATTDDQGAKVLPDVHVVGASALNKVISEQGVIDFIPITSLGSNFKEFYVQDANVVCIGGASLIEELYDMGALTNMYISIVAPTTENATMEADTFLNKKIFKSQPTKIFRTSINEKGEDYAHQQELWIL